MLMLIYYPLYLGCCMHRNPRSRIRKRRRPRSAIADKRDLFRVVDDDRNRKQEGVALYLYPPPSLILSFSLSPFDLCCCSIWTTIFYTTPLSPETQYLEIASVRKRRVDKV